MISLSINFYEEKPVNSYTPANTNKHTFTARDCYTLIKKYKKAGLKVGVLVGTRYTDKPIGTIVSFITPPKEGITVWNDEPSLLRVKNNSTEYEATYRRGELITYKLNKTTGEYEKC